MLRSFYTSLLSLRTLGIESGRNEAEMKTEEMEGMRERMARGTQKRVVLKSNLKR